MVLSNGSGQRSTTPDKLQPHNIEAEEAVLGALLIDPDAIIRVASLINPEDFYLQRHAWIFDAIQTLYQRREPTDLVTGNGRVGASEPSGRYRWSRLSNRSDQRYPNLDSR